MIILIYGLPGAGKTELAKELSSRINAVWLNADDVRADLSSDLGFTPEDRVEQARRMGAMARLLSSQGYTVVVDFVNPTSETRASFGSSDIAVWVNRIDVSRFDDTNAIWSIPASSDYNLEITAGLSVEEEVQMVMSYGNLYDWRKPTTLLLGRYQPWHEGHDALYDAAAERTDQVLIAVRDTYKTSEKDPLTYNEVVSYIDQYRDSSFKMKVPNITNIVYGRDVGYLIEQVELSQELQAISATQKRRELGIS